MAAVLGRRFDFDTLLEVTGEPEAPLLDAVEAPRQAPPVARGGRGRRVRLQPRQGARGGLPRPRRRAAPAAAPARGRGAGAARRRPVAGHASSMSTNARPSSPSISSAPRSGPRRCTTWCARASVRRRCSRCAMRCTGSTVRPRCARRTRRPWTRRNAWACTPCAARRARRPGRPRARWPICAWWSTPRAPPATAPPRATRWCNWAWPTGAPMPTKRRRPAWPKRWPNRAR